ncbi:hypothetical protein ScPMuIL_002802 [Solemya velum]
MDTSIKKGIKKDGLSSLHALLPGAKINHNKGTILVNIGTTKETLIFNIGGTRFETYRSTLYKIPRSPLANEEFLKRHFREEKGDYFFDRDPDVFKALLNYLRTGELHIPSYVCGPAAKTEFEFWGISDKRIESCCWTNYNSWNSTLEALNQLEHDRKESFGSELETQITSTLWGEWKSKAWKFLYIPDSSKPAKAFGWISLICVLVSIFSFLVETLPVFRQSRETYRERSIQNSSYLHKHTIVNASDLYNVSTQEWASKNESLGKEGTSKEPLSLLEFLTASSHYSFFIIDWICVSFFTLEYISRLIVVPNRFKYIRSMLGIIDLLALLPDYTELLIYAFDPNLGFSNSFVNVISAMRVLRVLRIFRLIRHVPGLWILIYTLKASLNDLILLSVFLLVGMLLFSSLIYFAEDRETFTSIPHGFWWALITMTTVGYGDMYPTTPWGYVIGSFTALSGLLMIGFSVPILVNNFIMYYKHVQFAIQQDAEKRAEAKREAAEKCHHTNTDHSKIVADRKSNNNDTVESVPLVVIVDDKT